jgi:hypothetical protein
MKGRWHIFRIKMTIIFYFSDFEILKWKYLKNFLI